jgi:4-hydroxyproline epimerase
LFSQGGGFLYPLANEDADIGILFIETSGCLPMCGHGTMGIVTFGLENGLIHPRTPGRFAATDVVSVGSS